MKALIADDDVENREILVRMLAHAGWDADAVGYDAALLDLAMPGVDGFEAARRIRAGGSRIALVAVSGAEADDLARESGFDYCLEKPYTLEDLRRVLRDIRKSAAPRE